MLKYNGTEVKDLKFNGIDVKRVIWDNVIVFPDNEFAPGKSSSLASDPPIRIVTNISASSTTLLANTEYTIIIKGAGYESSNGSLNAYGPGGISRIKFNFSSDKTMYLTKPHGGAGPTSIMDDGGSGVAISLADGEITVGSSARDASNLLIVAGGGGNTSGGAPIYAGGAGGGATGGQPNGGDHTKPTGGTQTSAGRGGTGTGSSGGNASGPYGGAGGKNGTLGAGVGGAGGGGYFGGGGGGGASFASSGRQGGAGGSGYAATSENVPGVIESSTSTWASMSSTVRDELGALRSTNQNNNCWFIRARGVSLTDPPPQVTNIQMFLISVSTDEDGNKRGTYYVKWDGVESNSNICKIRVRDGIRSSHQYTELDYTEKSCVILSPGYEEGETYTISITSFNGLRESEATTYTLIPDFSNIA